ncbi:MAG: histidine phosphatase family protein [Anaerolineales bacterium]|nr:histidine phosphatase family protein [Anaerolineales bacterium]MCS7247504.1 histidine phosphatase family protein [Anaerolineales bacterium]MDW8161315.1 histidine phosphatase family protein [Anaerolineales bacterium]MDW8446223.1 histidine phosphatase family protein [Anaerolineales bacterium]
MTRFILVRHGQTEWNRVERFRGQADVPLNEVGLKQAEATGKRIAREWQVSAIYSSPLSRALRTAEAIATYSSVPVQPHPNLTDINYGDWQGLSPEEVAQRWKDELDRWYHQPHLCRIPNGESLEDVRQRILQAIRLLAKQHLGQTIVVVGHTVINRVLLLAILGLGNDRFWHLRQATCAINVFEEEEGDFTLVSLNDTCHLNDLS